MDVINGKLNFGIVMSLLRQTAFTLLEILIVLGIIGLALALVPPLLVHTLDHSRVKSATRELAAVLNVARMQAIDTRAEATLVLDAENKTYKLGTRERRLRLPAASSLLLTTAESEQIDKHTGAIRFYPDGSSTGGRIQLSLPDSVTYVVDVIWLTGKVTISP